MKEILEYVARHLVDDPDSVDVTEVQGERSVILQLRVAPDDMGKVIGKKGRTAKAIRSVIRAAGIQRGVSTIVEIVETSAEESVQDEPDREAEDEPDEHEGPEEDEAPEDEDESEDSEERTG